MRWKGNGTGKGNGRGGKLRESVRSNEERNELAENNKNMVPKVIKTFFRMYPAARRYYSSDDAYSDGYLGLLRAASLYEESRGNKFSTYAYLWIHHFIQAGYYNQGFLIQCPRGTRINIESAFEDDSCSCYRPMVDPVDFEEFIQSREKCRRVQAALDQIKPREALVIRLRMQGQKLKDIAKTFDITIVRVRQIEARGMKRLLKYL